MAKQVYLRFPGREQREVPERMWQAACRRVEYLGSMTMHATLSYLLACAYMQGINDALDVSEQSAARDHSQGGEGQDGSSNNGAR